MQLNVCRCCGRCRWLLARLPTPPAHPQLATPSYPLARRTPRNYHGQLPLHRPRRDGRARRRPRRARASRRWSRGSAARSCGRRRRRRASRFTTSRSATAPSSRCTTSAGATTCAATGGSTTRRRTRSSSCSTPSTGGGCTRRRPSCSGCSTTTRSSTCRSCCSRTSRTCRAALPAGEVEAMLNLGAIRDRKWNCLGCSAVRGDGVVPGLQWLASHPERRSLGRAARGRGGRSHAAPMQGRVGNLPIVTRGSSSRSPTTWTPRARSRRRPPPRTTTTRARRASAALRRRRDDDDEHARREPPAAARPQEGAHL